MSESSWGASVLHHKLEGVQHSIEGPRRREIWLDSGLQWLALPSDKRGRNRTFSDAAIQFV